MNKKTLKQAHKALRRAEIVFDRFCDEVERAFESWEDLLEAVEIAPVAEAAQAKASVKTKKTKKAK